MVKDIDTHLIYTDSNIKDYISASMLRFGYNIFNKAYCIDNIDKYRTTVKKQIELSNRYFSLKESSLVLPKSVDMLSLHSNELIEELAQITFNALLDSIKICICFENYFKAKLFRNGYIIHIINSKESKLRKQQKKKPIHLKDILKKKLFTASDLKENLLDNTIGLSTLLNKEYSALYDNVPHNVISYLIDLNKKRNHLHMYQSESFSMGNSLLKDLEKLRSIVLCDIAVYHNVIIDSYKAFKNQKLPVECV